MQNLIRLIWKYRNTFLFIFLQVISTILIIKGNNYHQNNFYSSYLEVAGFFYSKENSFYNYFKLKKENEKLLEENSILLSQVDFSLDIKSRSALLYKDSMYNLQFEYVPAKILSNTFDRKQNHLILNQGTNHEIKSEMGVIFNQKIVGVVKDVSANFCSVRSILNEKLQISAKIKKNNYLGRLNWSREINTSKTIGFHDIPNHVNAEIGDTIITKGASGIFPEGILIGKIVEVSSITGSNFLDIKVELSLEFRNLSNCHIVKNIFIDELNVLKEGTQE